MQKQAKYTLMKVPGKKDIVQFIDEGKLLKDESGSPYQTTFSNGLNALPYINTGDMENALFFLKKTPNFEQIPVPEKKEDVTPARALEESQGTSKREEVLKEMTEKGETLPVAPEQQPDSKMLGRITETRPWTKTPKPPGAKTPSSSPATTPWKKKEPAAFTMQMIPRGMGWDEASGILQKVNKVKAEQGYGEAEKIFKSLTEGWKQRQATQTMANSKKTVKTANWEPMPVTDALGGASHTAWSFESPSGDTYTVRAISDNPEYGWYIQLWQANKMTPKTIGHVRINKGDKTAEQALEEAKRLAEQKANAQPQAPQPEVQATPAVLASGFNSSKLPGRIFATAASLEEAIDAQDARKQEGNWQVSTHEPQWQKNSIGKEYQCVWQPSTGRRGFLGRDDIVYFDQELSQVMPKYTSRRI